MNDLIEVVGLYRKDKNGRTFWTGKARNDIKAGQGLIMFEVQKKNDRQPDFDVKAFPEDGQQQAQQQPQQQSTPGYTGYSGRQNAPQQSRQMPF